MTYHEPHNVETPAVLADPLYEAVGAFVSVLRAAGVEHVSIAPGARSTPLVLALASEPGLHLWSHVDERSAAFFALGIAKQTRRPVAVVCTSGTAAANCLPAVVEAQAAEVPMLVLTADRPPELRACGAPQSIDQIKLYGGYTKWFAEAGGPETGGAYFRSLAARAVAFALAAPRGPVHVNFPFGEPLMPRAALPVRTAVAATLAHQPQLAADARMLDGLGTRLRHSRRPLIVCGPGYGDDELAAAVTALAERCGAPILADPLSQLRCGGHDLSHVIASYDPVLRHEPMAARLAPDLVLRIGAMPRSKPLLQYLQRQPTAPQIVLHSLAAWSDPSLSATEMIGADPTLVCAALLPHLRGGEASASWLGSWRRAGDCAAAALAADFEAIDEMFEGKALARLAARLPDDAMVFVGNSMPVRDLESFWPAGSQRRRFLCNHGANGIDGFVSSALGVAASSGVPVFAVSGDLGFYHDLNGLLAAKRYPVAATFIVLNNDGGGIFSFLPQAESGARFEELFATPHGLDFHHAARLYGTGFERVASWSDFDAAVASATASTCTTVIEVTTVGRDRNVALHRKLWRNVATALERL